MTELKQPNSHKSTSIQSTGNCIYISPSDNVVDAYAQAVCDALEQKFGNPANDQKAEFIRGFSNFIKVVNRIQVKHLNKGVLYEEPETQSEDRT
jgi:hypothetical protein